MSKQAKINVPGMLQDNGSELQDNGSGQDNGSVPQDNATATYSIAELLKFDPEAIKARQAEIAESHKLVARFVGMLPEDSIKVMRDQMGITTDLQSDLNNAALSLGGNVATVYAALKTDQAWEKVTEYTTMISSVNTVNMFRAALGLPMLTVKIGGRHQGSAATLAATTHTKNMTGYMQPGRYEFTYKGSKVVYIATDKHIAITVNDLSIYNEDQGEMSLSKTLNEYVLPACGAEENSRIGMPKFLTDNGFDPAEIMLHAAPGMPTEK